MAAAALESTVLLSGEDQEVADTLGVTPLVIVPRDELDEVAVECDAGVRIKDGRVLVASEVGRDDLLVSVANDALVGRLGCLFDGLLDLVVGCTLLQADDEVNHGDIDGGDTERKTAERTVRFMRDIRARR